MNKLLLSTPPPHFLLLQLILHIMAISRLSMPYSTLLVPHTCPLYPLKFPFLHLCQTSSPQSFRACLRPPLFQEVLLASLQTGLGAYSLQSCDTLYPGLSLRVLSDLLPYSAMRFWRTVTSPRAPLISDAESQGGDGAVTTGQTRTRPRQCSGE